MSSMANRNTDNTSELIKALREEAQEREQRAFLMSAVVKPYSGRRNTSQINKFFLDILRKAEGFQLSDEQLIILVGKNLEGPALEWYLEYKQTRGISTDFNEFREQLTSQFVGNIDISNLISKYLNIKQTKSVELYNEKITQAKEEVPKDLIAEEVKLSAYLDGLKKEISREVRVKRPKTLSEAMRIAAIYDESTTLRKSKTRFIRNSWNYMQENDHSDDMEIDLIDTKKKYRKVGFDERKDSNGKFTRKLTKNSIVNVNEIKAERKIENEKRKQSYNERRTHNKLREKYVLETETEIEDLPGKGKCMMEIQGKIKRTENVLENSCDVNFIEKLKLKKEPEEKTKIRGKGKSKLQESLFIVPVRIRNKESKALIDSGAQSNFIAPRLVEEMKLVTEVAPEVVLTTATGEERKANKKITINLGIGTELVEVQLYIAEFKHPIILGRPFITQYVDEIDSKEETVFGIKNCARKTQDVKFIDSNQFLRDTRPKEGDIGMFYITEENSDIINEIPEFIKKEFSDVVTNKCPERLPDFKSVTHRIHLIEVTKPTTKPSYRISQYEIEELKKQIKELL